MDSRSKTDSNRTCRWLFNALILVSLPQILVEIHQIAESFSAQRQDWAELLSVFCLCSVQNQIEQVCV